MVRLRQTIAWILAALTAFWALAGHALHTHAPHASEHSICHDEHSPAKRKCTHSHRHGSAIAAKPAALEGLSSAIDSHRHDDDCAVCQHLAKGAFADRIARDYELADSSREWVAPLAAPQPSPFLQGYSARGPPALPCGS